ncbi:protein of unknown function [Taphrina deformans PYCC 5710]|uniref:Uncharacterized protein n=1 Tax=Taphrina deformans (strain PYCC 5710 / ATCC 11124 / CBS 356.35 / IMI 108563 / JCM 9778 / NBRC 8474) TaxID=1097556 RepID=R4X9W5_TAPDE|nr:protein of unknown function [Taphrina deformans PYCC 5710]|eukprot:CCG82287.1 protein of unknown function [Taphrina deformans PYCC 5710]
MEIPTLTPRSALLFSAGAWTFNFLCQLYGMLSDPNMKDVADKYHAFLSPNPFAIALFFFPQSVIQVYWIYRLYRSSTASNASEEGDDEAVRYAPVFVLGNVCIGLWMVFWNNEHLGIADIFVNINSAAQLYYVFAVLAPISNENKLTHVVAKMFAGIGILDVVDNASSAFANYQFNGYTPGIVTYILTVVAAAGLGYISDPILGACIVYDFLALFAGQISRGMWAFVLLISAGISGALVAFKGIQERDTYQSLLSGQTGNVI